MGMGYTGNFADVVDTKFVKRMVGKKLYAEFQEIVDKEGAESVFYVMEGIENLERKINYFLSSTKSVC